MNITSPRHPIAVMSYVLTLALGVVFLTGYLGTGQQVEVLFAGVPYWVIRVWEWQLVGGSALALFGVFWPSRPKPGWPGLTDLLHIEGIGSLLSGIGLVIYTYVGVNLVGLREAGPSLCLLTPLIAGRFLRGWQTFREHTRIERASLTAQAVEQAQQIEDQRKRDEDYG